MAPPPPCSYLPLPSPMMLGDYPQIPPPMETQYHGDDARRVHLSETNFVDEKGKKPMSLEDFMDPDVEANLDEFMDPCLLIDFSLFDKDDNSNLHDKI